MTHLPASSTTRHAVRICHLLIVLLFYSSAADPPEHSTLIIIIKALPAFVWMDRPPADERQGRRGGPAHRTQPGCPSCSRRPRPPGKRTPRRPPGGRVRSRASLDARSEGPPGSVLWEEKEQGGKTDGRRRNPEPKGAGVRSDGSVQGHATPPKFFLCSV